jgi:polysaccharide deacetylase family sporulation protein PdaB
MQMIRFTGKKIKRIVVLSSLAAATAAVGIVAALTSVGTQAAERKLPIYCVERGDKKISLTFDVAWENSNTDELIEILDDYDASATFFVTGDWCDRYPDDVKKFYDAGHEIQNHSDEHPHIEGININDLISDTREAARKIKMITGEEPTLYRAPYGEYDDTSLTTLEGMGYKVIQWDVDSVDWNDPSPEEITKKVLENVKSGSILLFHNDLDNTTQALPQILSQLKDDGYEFVTVSDLIYTESYSIDANGMQIPDVQSSLEINAENVDEVIAMYSDTISAAGYSDEQVETAIAAIKSGAEIPDEIQEVIAQIYSEAAVTVSAAADKGEASDSDIEIYSQYYPLETTDGFDDADDVYDIDDEDVDDSDEAGEIDNIENGGIPGTEGTVGTVK